MSFNQTVPPLGIAPTYPRAIRLWDPRAYWQVLRDLVYFPQRPASYDTLEIRSQANPHSRSRWDLFHFFGVVAIVTAALVIASVSSVWLLHRSGPAPWLGAGQVGWVALWALGVAALSLAAAFVGKGFRAPLIPAAPLAIALGLWMMAWRAAPIVGIGGGFLGSPWLVISASAATGWAANAFALPFRGRQARTVVPTLAALVALLITLGAISSRFAPVSSATAVGGWFAQVRVLQILGLSVLATMVAIVAALRVDDWLLFGHLRRVPPDGAWRRIARVTLLPVYRLEPLLGEMLDSQDGPRQGVERARHLWLHTQQQESVLRALRHAAWGPPKAKSSDDDTSARVITASERKAIARRGELAIYLADYAEAMPWVFWWLAPRPRLSELGPIQKGRNEGFADEAAYTVRVVESERLRASLRLGHAPTPLRTDTPSQAVAAGLTLLGEGQMWDAAYAFRRAEEYVGGARLPSVVLNEVATLIKSLSDLAVKPDLAMQERLVSPPRPLLPERRASWDCLEDLHEAVKLAAVARRCRNDVVRARAITLVKERLARAQMPPQLVGERVEGAEQTAMRALATRWSAESGRESSLEATLAAPLLPLLPVKNPFIYAEPCKRGVQNSIREPQILTLQEAWSQRQLFSVTMRGLHHVGKTSLLSYVGQLTPSAEVAVLSLNHVTLDRALLPSLLVAVSNEVRRIGGRGPLAAPTLPGGAAYPMGVPSFIPGSEPFVVVEQSVHDACDQIFPRALILVLDDFDRVYGALQHAVSDVDFMALLSHLVDRHPNFGMVFVRQANLRTQSAEEPELLRKSLQLAVPPLEAARIDWLLRPSTIPVRFSNEATEHIQWLSGGHPWIVQLIAHTAFGDLNRRLVTGVADPLLDVHDVDRAVSEPLVDGHLDMHFRRVTQEALAGLNARQRTQYAQMLVLVAEMGPATRTLAEIAVEAAMPHRQISQDVAEVESLLNRMVECWLLAGGVAGMGHFVIRGELYRRWILGHHATL